MEENELQTQEVLELVKKLKPGFGENARGQEGFGLAHESVFSFAPSGHWYWIVFLHHTYAFMPITPSWVQVYSNLILLSPKVKVEFCFNHRITAWSATQDKMPD